MPTEIYVPITAFEVEMVATAGRLELPRGLPFPKKAPRPGTRNGMLTQPHTAMFPCRADWPVIPEFQTTQPTSEPQPIRVPQPEVTPQLEASIYAAAEVAPTARSRPYNYVSAPPKPRRTH